MSHFTLQIDANGPILNIGLGVSEPRAAALVAANQPVPNTVPMRALLDTGASSTCVDPTILTGQLGLTPTGQADCLTPTTGSVPVKKDLYDVSLRIFSGATDPILYFPTIAAMESDLFAAQGIHALIGRDVLSKCIVYYNGTTGLFTLAF